MAQSFAVRSQADLQSLTELEKAELDVNAHARDHPTRGDHHRKKIAGAPSFELRAFKKLTILSTELEAVDTRGMNEEQKAEHRSKR